MFKKKHRNQGLSLARAVRLAHQWAFGLHEPWVLAAWITLFRWNPLLPKLKKNVRFKIEVCPWLVLALTIWIALCFVSFSVSGLFLEPHSVFLSKATTSPSLILYPQSSPEKDNHQYIDKTVLLASVYPTVIYCFQRFFQVHTSTWKDFITSLNS